MAEIIRWDQGYHWDDRIDGRPLAQAGVPETREYMMRGVVEDEEVGLDSDIISITWGGA